MRRTIIGFLSFLTAFVAVGFLSTERAFAGGDCRKYEYTAPPGVSILTKDEVLARVAGHTVDAPDYQLWFGRDGALLININFEIYLGNWYSCGVVVVLDYVYDEHDKKRLLAIPEEGQISFYTLSGELRATRALKKGKIF